jgi:hypothetical protein
MQFSEHFGAQETADDGDIATDLQSDVCKTSYRAALSSEQLYFVIHVFH